MKLELENITLEKLFDYLSFIKERGDMVFIKLDGERDNNSIVVIISYPPSMNSVENRIMFQGDNLKDLLIKLVYHYYEKHDL